MQIKTWPFLNWMLRTSVSTRTPLEVILAEAYFTDSELLC